MKSLLLLRHAEAQAASADGGDHERSLTRRGQTQARALGRWLKRRDVTPGRILCSSATRARQTAESVTRTAGWNVPLHAVDGLYNATADTMLDLVRHQSGEDERVLLVAHAPGVGDLASLLVTRHVDLALVCEPATLIEIVFDAASWTDVAARRGALRLVLPSD